MKILIVDDSKSARFLMEEMLFGYGKCDIAENGLEAVEAFESAIDSGEPYGIVFLDIIMPEMNGQEALIKMREIEEDNEIMELDEAAIIMTTGLSDSKSITDAIHGGEATSYIVKPVSKEKLTEKLSSLGLIAIV
jgi:two-component system chemotaxis response regulator CheY